MNIMMLVIVTFMHHRSTVSCACVFTHMFALELLSTLSFAQVAFFVTWQKVSILRKSDDMIPSHHRVFAPFLLRHCWRPPPCSPSCLTDGTLAVRFSDICYCVWWGFWWWWQGFLGQIFRYLVATKLLDVDAHPPTRLLAGSLFLFEERFRYLYIRAKRLGWSSHW